MYPLHNHRQRKPDFLSILLLLVGIALLVTLALQVDALNAQAAVHNAPQIGQPERIWTAWF